MTPYVGTFPEDTELSPNFDLKPNIAAGLYESSEFAQDGQDVAAAEADGDDSLHAMDLVQAGLALVGMADFFPPLAIAADSLNTAISSWRGDTTGAALGVTSMAPGLGLGAGAANIAHHLKPVTVLYSRRAEKELKKVPKEIAASLRDWEDAVKKNGLTKVRKIPGYNDHQIDHGEHKGRRAIRLNHVYRAFYKQLADGKLLVESVNRHLYYNK